VPLLVHSTSNLEESLGWLARVEKVVRLLVYGVALALLALKGYRVTENSYGGSDNSALRAKALIGRKIERPSAFRNTTLYVAMTTTCIYCRESAPFYRQLIEEVQPHADGKLTIAAVIPGRGAADYLGALGLRFESIVSSMPGVKVWATPTLFLVDSTGTVRNIWVGQLPKRKEAEVIAAIYDSTGIDPKRH
jgi:hypothetical protein